MHIPSLRCACLVLPARQWPLRYGNHVPQIPVASRLSMEPDTGGAGEHCISWQPQRCTAQLRRQENLLQERGWLTASRHRLFGPRCVSTNATLLLGYCWPVAGHGWALQRVPSYPLWHSFTSSAVMFQSCSVVGGSSYQILPSPSPATGLRPASWFKACLCLLLPPLSFRSIPLINLWHIYSFSISFSKDSKYLSSDNIQGLSQFHTCVKNAIDLPGTSEPMQTN